LLSGQQQLDEALALDPAAELVDEAVRLLGGGWDSALAVHDRRVRRTAGLSGLHTPGPETTRSPHRSRCAQGLSYRLEQRRESCISEVFPAF